MYHGVCGAAGTAAGQYRQGDAPVHGPGDLRPGVHPAGGPEPDGHDCEYFPVQRGSPAGERLHAPGDRDRAAAGLWHSAGGGKGLGGRSGGGQPE